MAEGAEKSDASPKPTPRRFRLDALQKCRQEAARLYWDGRSGRISPSDASRLASVLGLVATLLRDGLIEDRLRAIEARLGL